MFHLLAAGHIADERARFEIGEVEDLRARTADVVVSGLVLNFLPDPVAALAAMAACAPDGLVAAYMWDYAEGMVDADRLATLWQAAGLPDVRTESIEVPTVFVDFDDYWRPFLGGTGAAPGYMAAMTDDDRDALCDRLRTRVPTAADASTRLTSQAWTVQGSGVVPSRDETVGDRTS